MNILFVCTGNICRSPMAEAFFNHLAAQRSLSIRARSAGLGVVLDEATPEAIRAGREYGVDLHAHRSRQIEESMVREASLILTMTRPQTAALLEAFPAARGKTLTLLPFAGDDGDIADPYGGSQDNYRRCARQIWTAVQDGLDVLESKNFSL